ncbi:MAG: type II toxin-antitoxin system PrlF family antitoxin [Longimicrobiaceae bacterium]
MIYRSGEDPVIGAFLEFLAGQMQAQPHLIRGLSSLDRAEALVEGVEVDPDEDLGEDVTLD